MSKPTPIHTADTPQSQVKTGWIPASERLPESTGRYLVWVENEIQFANFAPGNPDGEKWVSDDMVDYINITHWMPLPERPE